MSFSKDTGRRRLVIAEALLVLADLESAVAKQAIDLPPGVIVDEVFARVEEAFNSSTSDAIVVGDSDDTDRYIASTSVQTTGYKAGAASGRGYKNPAADTIDVIWTSGGGTPTTGKLRVICKYYDPNEAEYVQR